MNNDLYQIKATEPFLIEHIYFFQKIELEKFQKFNERLKYNPYQGDHLRVSFVREFKTESGKRAYFLIYPELKIILYVAYSNKKNQQKIINEIFENLKEFKEYTYKNYKS